MLKQQIKTQSLPSANFDLSSSIATTPASTSPISTAISPPRSSAPSGSHQLKGVPSIALNDHEISLNQMDNSDIDTSSIASTAFSSIITSNTTASSASSASVAAPTSTANSMTRKDEIFSTFNIFDLIHGVQINCECSPLDKENSHFVIADLAIAAMELVKTSVRPSSQTTTHSQGVLNQQQKQQGKHSKYTPSPSIRISASKKGPRSGGGAVSETTESFLDLTLENSLSASLSGYGLRGGVSKSFSAIGVNNIRSDFYTTSKLPPSVGASITTTSLLLRKRSRSLNDLNSRRPSENNRPDPSMRPPSQQQQYKTPNFVLFENSIDSVSMASSSFSTSPTGLLRNQPMSKPSRLLKFSSPNRSNDEPSK